MSNQQMPYDLRIDSGGDEFAVSGPQPHLSWKLPLAWSRQDSCEVEARIAGTAEASVVVDSSQHTFLEWPYRPLRSGERVDWRVRVTCAEGTSAWSDWNSFEAGLLAPDWTADWITPDQQQEHQPGERPAYLLSTTFRVEREVAQARLYATAHGVYEVFVNGTRAGSAELAPGSTSYDATLYGQAADVAGTLTIGENAIDILLSDGWYRGRIGAFRRADSWGKTTAARLELHLQYADGSTSKIVTDTDWISQVSQITRADLMDGQTSDFTFRDPAPRKALLHTAPTPDVTWSPAPPIRKTTRLEPRAVTSRGNGTHIVDFGQNFSGWITLTDLGPAGTKTVIEYGEHLNPDGDLTTDHLNSEVASLDPVIFVQRDEVISAGHPAEVFEPRHTVHGFRYARVTREGEPFDPAGIVAEVVHTDLHRTGTFACSDETLNDLHSAADWSFRGNAVDVPTDCPTRERAGWTGDFQIFAPTAAYLYDIDGFARKWLRSVLDDQLDDGRIVNISPDFSRLRVNPDPQLLMVTGSSGWGDAVVLVPWLLHQFYGDCQILDDCWQAMNQWVDFALTTAATSRHPSRVERSAEPQPHEEFLWDGSFHWGEWLEPKERRVDGSFIDPLAEDPAAWFMADKGEVGTAFLYHSLTILASVAEALGNDKDARERAETAAKVRTAWQREFLDADGRIASGTQAGYVRALAFGLVPDEHRQAAADQLGRLIRANDTHLATGFLATADLLPVLADNGHADIAYDLLYQRSYPSWLGMLDRGATTIWENWDGVDETGHANASLNHYSKGAVVRFLYTHTLGLRQQTDSVAWESFVVAPVLDTRLTWAKGTLETPQGTINVSWEVEDTDLHIQVDVPQGSTATIIFPDGEPVTHGPGRFEERRPHRR